MNPTTHAADACVAIAKAVEVDTLAHGRGVREADIACDMWGSMGDVHEGTLPVAVGAAVHVGVT